ncbi:LysR family transcriptional regulator [Celeribacter sp.]|uniref:LysR family transcriptional regulator n=1 Tax=Celeribacter sp. TaxID=1890673 RepID=UPI003A951F3C
MQFVRTFKPIHLEFLLKIQEVGQLQVAAHLLNMTQPAASRMLKDIEERCGTTLFKRTPKGMEPTPSGEVFIKHARIVLAGLDSLEKEIVALATGMAGEVRVGSVTGPAIGVLIPAMEILRERAPNISVTIDVAPSVDLVRGLDEGKFDFVMARVPPTHDSRDLHVHPARNEQVRLLVNEVHPLLSHSNVTLEELSHYPWIMQERGSPIREAVETSFYAAGLPPPERVVNSSSLLIALALLKGTDMIAPLSEEVTGLMTSEGLGAKLRVINVAVPMTVSPYFIIRDRSRELTPAATLFYEQLLAEI